MQHGEFIISTDQRSLVHLNEQRLNTHWQQKVFTKLLGLQYKIVYKQGSENRVVDALSGRSNDAGNCIAISVVTPQWLQEITSGYDKDGKAKELVSKLAVSPLSLPNYKLESGLIKYKSRVWVGNDEQLHLKLIKTFHASPMGGHSGAPVTLR